MKLQNKFLGLLLPAGLLSAALVVFLIQRAVHTVIIVGLERSAVALARAAIPEAILGIASGNEAALLPVVHTLQRREGALYAAVVDGQGRFAAHTTIAEKGRLDPDPRTRSALLADEPSLWRMITHGEESLIVAVPIFLPETPTSEELLAAGTIKPQVRNRIGLLKVAVPTRAAQATERRIILEISMIVLAIGAVAFGLVVVLVRGMLAPIRGLMTGIASIGGGQYEVKVPVLSRDELGDLANSFNHMSTELARTTVSKDYVEGVLENMSDLLVVTDPEGLIQTVNRAAAAALGAGPDEVIGRPLASLFDEPPGFTGIAKPGSEGVRGVEVVLRTKAGARIPALFSCSVLRDRDGRLSGYIGVAKDITDRKRAEGELVTAKLAAEASSRELEAFSYSVAHDLRAPLRSLDGFSQILLDDYSEKLDDAGRDYLKRVRAGSRKMSQLIDDLLNLSRITCSVMVLESFDLSAFANEIGADLKRSEPARRVDFIIEPRLVVWGDANLLRVALVNLLSNAWKYTSRHSRARIQFGAEVTGGKATYFVRDDGAGFDMAFSKRLFQPFTRLHTAAEFEGTGIGLAIVQRVIARHEGRVWGEGAVERGAVFYFTLWDEVKGSL